MKFHEMPFKKQVEYVLSKKRLKNRSDLLLVRKDTPKILRLIGIPNLPILITQQHIISISQSTGKYKNVNYHGLGKELLYQLPKLLEKPVLVAKSFTKGDSIVLLTNKEDDSHNSIIIILKMCGYGSLQQNILTANIVTSMYGKNNICSFVNRIINDNALLAYNKIKSHHLPVTSGLQLPSGIANFDFNIIVKTLSIIVNKDK
ncbi:MAG: hypothetical protein MJ214_03390 [Bacilli bacterium]|nr:hypothetical protein [Bacilli bacterium]